MQVVVFDTDNKIPIGVGEMHLEDLRVVDDDDDTKILFILKDHPHIVMEDGKLFAGIECWWMPVAEFVTANQRLLPAFGRVECQE